MGRPRLAAEPPDSHRMPAERKARHLTPAQQTPGSATLTASSHPFESMMLIVGASAFLLIKLIAYAAWCWLGLRLLATPPPDRPARRALALGLVRVGLGFGLGWLLVLTLTIIAPENRPGFSFPALVVSSVVLRWLVWSFVGALASGHANRPRVVLRGRSSKEHLWRIGGVGVSYATDVASFLGVGALGLIPC